VCGAVSPLADMRRKLEIHLLPHFGHIQVTELTSRDVEAYLDRKLAENRRIEAARAIGEPLTDDRGRALRTLRPQTINSHLHLLAEILARAVREGVLARNPAEGDDLRLEARREKKYGLELDEAMALVEAAGTLDQRPAPSDALRRRILDMRAAGTAWRALAAELGIADVRREMKARARHVGGVIAPRPELDSLPASRPPPVSLESASPASLTVLVRSDTLKGLDRAAAQRGWVAISPQGGSLRAGRRLDRATSRDD
jgi:hypothetical protein